jgi:hypothetical protein
VINPQVYDLVDTARRMTGTRERLPARRQVCTLSCPLQCSGGAAAA